MNISATQYREMVKPKNKYGAVRSYRCKPCGAAVEQSRPCLACGEVEQIKFASKGEAKRYDVLRRMLDQGHIRDLELHPSYDLEVRGLKVCKATFDFRYVTHEGRLVIEEFKGVDQRHSKITRKLFTALHGIEVDVIQ